MTHSDDANEAVSEQCLRAHLRGVVFTRLRRSNELISLILDRNAEEKQSEQAFLALAQGSGSAVPAVKILEYEEMEPFFVAGDRDAPRAGGCEGDKRERRQRQPSAGATYFRMLSITCAL